MGRWDIGLDLNLDTGPGLELDNYRINQMELLQSQARTERELSGILADRSVGI